MGNFDFSKIIAQEQEKQEAAMASGGNSANTSPYPTLYPFGVGKFDLKFIGNEPSGMLYREIYYHQRKVNNNTFKIPCLKRMYGIDCPVCNQVQKVQDMFDDKNVYRKYGAVTRGIMFAQLISFEPANYFGDNHNHPKPGDIVLFMFPKSVITQLTNLIVEFGDELDSLFTNNTTRLITLKITMGNNGFPDYVFYTKNTNVTLCVDGAGNPDDNAFNEFMANMPDLREMKFGSEPTEQDLKSINAIVEEMNALYFSGVAPSIMFNPVNSGNVDNVSPAQVNTNNTQPNINMGVNITPAVSNASTTPVTTSPTPVAQSKPVETNTVPENEKVETVPAPTNSATTSTPVNNTQTSQPTGSPEGNRPPCFGDNKYDDKCAACPWDSQCV